MVVSVLYIEGDLPLWWFLCELLKETDHNGGVCD